MPEKLLRAKINNRTIELISLPIIILAGVLMRLFLPFVSWIKAAILTYGVIDGVGSNHLYREEKFFPYQFIRYGRIIANLLGVINIAIPICWNIGDGVYSIITYREKHSTLEQVPRYGRIVAGLSLTL